MMEKCCIHRRLISWPGILIVIGLLAFAAYVYWDAVERFLPKAGAELLCNDCDDDGD